MKYLIVGAGGTGGILGYYLSRAGRDCVLIARGEHLRVMRENGLTVLRQWENSEETQPVQAYSMEEYLADDRENAGAAGCADGLGCSTADPDCCVAGSYGNAAASTGDSAAPDVIFVCVKGYSLDGVVPFLNSAAGPDTVIIPILNIFGTGGRLQEKLPGKYVLDGCIYVSANREAPGLIRQHAPILRVLFGARRGQETRPVLDEIQKDLNECGITGIHSENIERDALGKFSYVSPIGAAGLYFGAVAGDFQRDPEKRAFFAAMIREIARLAKAMGFPFQEDYVKLNMEIMDKLPPDADTSMQRDVAAGRQSEVDGLVYQVVRMGKKYSLPLPYYEKVAAELERRGL